MIIFAFVIFAAFLFYQAYLIGGKKLIEKISCIDDKRYKKIKNKEKVAKDYSNILIFMAIGCVIGAILAYFFGTPIAYIAFIPVIWGALMLSGFTAKIDEKIKNKIY